MATTDPATITACSLDADGAARRAAEFRALLAPRVRRLHRDGATAVLDLDLGLRAERELAGLLDRERECCPYVRFSLTRRTPRRVRLEVTASPPFEDALDAFLDLARSNGAEEPVLRVGEAARRAGVGLETLRYYERRGLLPRPLRRPSGQREYTLEDVRRILAIKAAQRLGFTLAQAREILGVTGAGPSRDPGALRVQAEAKLAEVDDRIRGLELMRAELRAVIAAQCDLLIDCDCGDCPIDGDAPPVAARPRLLQVTR